jgi:hypothetical protein
VAQIPTWASVVEFNDNLVLPGLYVMGIHKQRLMLEDEAKLQETADRVVVNMLAANVAEKKFYTDERLKKEYSNLITPDAFDKKLIVIAVLGYPEQVGVWSYTLLRHR